MSGGLAADALVPTNRPSAFSRRTTCRPVASRVFRTDPADLRRTPSKDLSTRHTRRSSQRSRILLSRTLLADYSDVHRLGRARLLLRALCLSLIHISEPTR